MHTLKARFGAALIALLVSTGLGGAIAVASQSHVGQTTQSSGCLDGWPGNGYGDQNHNHTGPPPQSGIYCGNGYGDQNKTHNGPPGQLGK